MKWRQDTPTKNIWDCGNNPPAPPPHTILCPPASCSFSLSLPQLIFKHVWVSMHMHAPVHTHTQAIARARTLMRLVHTSFNTYRCRALWFSSSQKTRKCTEIVKACVIIYVHKCSWHGRGAIEIAHPREGNFVYNYVNGNASVFMHLFRVDVSLNLDLTMISQFTKCNAWEMFLFLSSFSSSPLVFFSFFFSFF